MSKWFGLKCRLRMCGHLPKSDNKGCWAECVTCGRKSAYVDRKVIRSYIELMEAHYKHDELVKELKDEK